MDEQQRSCIICLDTPQEKNPLHLLSCGCKTAWFHTSCADTWLSHIPLVDYPPACPTCKRYVILKIKYSFQFKAGLNQKYLWFTLSLFPVEILLALSFCLQLKNIYVTPFYIPIQSIFMLTIPYIIRSKYDINFFLHNYRFKVLVQFFILLYYMLRYRYSYYIFVDQIINTIILFNFVHFLSLFLIHVKNRFSAEYEYMDLYLPYVKGYEFEYVNTLFFKNVTTAVGDGVICSTKSITSSTETNKPILRRSNRIRGSSL
jgi:hypothetical protein